MPRQDDNWFSDAQAIHEALITWARKSGWQSGSLIVYRYRLRDGSYAFSQNALLLTMQTILEESGTSHRLLVIVCHAYLEDQLRLLLERYLVNDDVTRTTLERSSFAVMCSFAYSLGLIAKTWYEALKTIGNLRNTFAHRPQIQTFDDLLQNEPKTRAALEKLKRWLSDTTLEQPAELVSNAFMHLHALLQFAIDHLAIPDQRVLFDPAQMSDYMLYMGLSLEDLQTHVKNPEHWKNFPEE